MNIIRLNSIGEPFAKSGQATPPSGGGTEGGGIKFYKFPTPSSLDAVSEEEKVLLYNAARVRIEDKNIGMTIIGQTFAGGGLLNDDNILSITAFAIDRNAQYIQAMQGEVMFKGTIEEFIGFTDSSFSLDNYEEITEEQFYAL